MAENKELALEKSKRKIEILRRLIRSKDFIFISALVLGNFILIWQLFSAPFSFTFSAPVVPLLGRFLGIFGLEFEAAVRGLLLAFFALGPLSLYFLVREMSGRRMSAGVAAILYTLPIFRSRFEALTIFGDGAHVASLTLIPLAAYLLLKFLKRGSFVSAIGSSISVLLVALTSPFGLFVLFGFLTVITFSEMLLGSGRLKFMRFLLVIVFAVGLSAFWYNPEFVRLTLVSTPGKVVIATIKNLVPISFFTLPILGTFGFLIFDKRPHLQPLFIALGLTIMFGMISFAGGLAKFAVSEQSRYLPEVAMSIAILWGVVGVFAYDLLPLLPKSRWFPVPKARRRLLQRVSIGMFGLLCIVLVIVFPFGRDLSERGRGELSETTSVVIGISEIREQTGLGHRIFGYSISAITAIGLVVLQKRLAKEEIEREPRRVKGEK